MLKWQTQVKGGVKQDCNSRKIVVYQYTEKVIIVFKMVVSPFIQHLKLDFL